MNREELNKLEAEGRAFIGRKLNEAHQNFAKHDYTLDQYLAVLKSIEAVSAALSRTLAGCLEDR